MAKHKKNPVANPVAFGTVMFALAGGLALAGLYVVATSDERAKKKKKAEGDGTDGGTNGGGGGGGSKPLGYDPKRARQLLAELKYPVAINSTKLGSAESSLVQAFQAEWNALLAYLDDPVSQSIKLQSNTAAVRSILASQSELTTDGNMGPATFRALPLAVQVQDAVGQPWPQIVDRAISAIENA